MSTQTRSRLSLVFKPFKTLARYAGIAVFSIGYFLVKDYIVTEDDARELLATPNPKSPRRPFLKGFFQRKK